MNTDVSRTDLAYLHGLRVLSLFWIILIHINIQAANGSWPYGKWIKAVAENNCVSRVLKWLKTYRLMIFFSFTDIF